MASADDVANWMEAINCFEAGQYDDAILQFQSLTPTARVMFNIGCCFLSSTNDFSRALQKFNHATSMDSHLAVAYFLQGEINFRMEKYSVASKSFESAHHEMRGKSFIDYRPLGLNHILHEWQVVGNLLVTDSRLGTVESMVSVTHELEQNDFIAQIISSTKNGAPTDIVKFLPVSLFKPKRANVQNLGKKDYLGQAKVVSTENTQEIYSTFSGKRMVEKEHNSPKSRPRKPLPPYSSPPSLSPMDISPQHTPMKFNPSMRTPPTPSKTALVAQHHQQSFDSTTSRCIPPRKPLPIAATKSAPTAPRGVSQSLEQLQMTSSTSIGSPPKRPAQPRRLDSVACKPKPVPTKSIRPASTVTASSSVNHKFQNPQKTPPSKPAKPPRPASQIHQNSPRLASVREQRPKISHQNPSMNNNNIISTSKNSKTVSEIQENFSTKESELLNVLFGRKISLENHQPHDPSISKKNNNNIQPSQNKHKQPPATPSHHTSNSTSISPKPKARSIPAPTPSPKKSSPTVPKRIIQKVSTANPCHTTSSGQFPLANPSPLKQFHASVNALPSTNQNILRSNTTSSGKPLSEPINITSGKPCRPPVPCATSTSGFSRPNYHQKREEEEEEENFYETIDEVDKINNNNTVQGKTPTVLKITSPKPSNKHQPRDNDQHQNSKEEDSAHVYGNLFIPLSPKTKRSAPPKKPLPQLII